MVSPFPEMSIVLGIFTFVLVLVACFLILVILMQKDKSGGGAGAVMGGAMAEAAFGADTSNVLSKATINASIIFFVLSCALFLGRIYERKHMAVSGGALPTIVVPAASQAPAGPAKAPPPAGSKKP